MLCSPECHAGPSLTEDLHSRGSLRRFNVYHAVHSTSMLPLSKVSLLQHGDSKAIFCSASPEAFEEHGVPLDQTNNEQLASVLEHRQLCISMASGNVYVRRQLPRTSNL